jgi:hypothetical protein
MLSRDSSMPLMIWRPVILRMGFSLENNSIRTMPISYGVPDSDPKGFVFDTRSPVTKDLKEMTPQL